jgi:hypothetical protein
MNQTNLISEDKMMKEQNSIDQTGLTQIPGTGKEMARHLKCRIP